MNYISFIRLHSIIHSFIHISIPIPIPVYSGEYIVRTFALADVYYDVLYAGSMMIFKIKNNILNSTSHSSIIESQAYLRSSECRQSAIQR